ncbi:MAG: hypothetical protein Q7J84_17500 [Sulfuricaulis sp.]|nr:hypothetical protein [Sulfuricaulis sp.]
MNRCIKLVFLQVLIALSGCAAAPVAQIPVAVPCVPANAPTMPSVTENADLAKLDDRALVLRIASERLDLLSYSVQASMIVEACR